MNVYEYIVKLNDKASSKIQQIAKAAGHSDKKLVGLKKRLTEVDIRASLMGRTFSRLKRVLATAFVGVSAGLLLGNVISITSEMEKYEAVLTNTFQSAEKGKASMDLIRKFAAETPFQINELTDSYVKMVNRGIIPTKKELTSLGDLASSQGKSFGQLTEAILDAGTNEFERLKEFGILAKKHGSQVIFTFKGVSQSVSATESSIKDYLIGLGNMKGVHGAMASISATLGGRISNLKDKWANLMYTIGTAGGDALKKGVSMLSDGLGWISDNFGRIKAEVRDFISILSPLVASLRGFVVSAMGGSEASGLLAARFSLVKNTIEIFANGLATLIGWLTPIAPLLRNIAIFVGILTVAVWALSAPFTVIGILLVAFIGYLVTAYNRTGKFRAVVLATGTTLRGFGSIIKNYVVNSLRDLLSGLSNVFDAMVALKNGDWDGALSFGKQAADDMFVGTRKRQLLKDGMGLGSDISASYKSGFYKDFKKSGFKNPLSLGNLSTKGVMGNFAGGGISGIPSSSSSASKGKGKAKSGFSGITGGGKKQTNITINLQKLQDKTEIHTTTLSGGIAQTEAQLSAMLLRVLNSANQMQTT